MSVAVPKGTAIVVAPECDSGQCVLEAARAVGCRVVTAAVVPPEQEENILWHLVSTPKNPGTCDRAIWRPDLASLADALADEKDVVAVIPGSEFGVEAAERLAEHFGVRGNPSATSSVRRNKFEMKRVIAAAGLDHARGTLVRSVEEAVAFVRANLAYPVIAKPPDGAAALNVFKCRDEAELRTAVACVLETPDGYGKVPHAAVVEEFIPGDEYGVNLLGDADRLVVTSVWRYEWIRTPYAEHTYLNDILQDPDDPALADLCAYAKRLYRAIGIRLGPAHAEIKFSPRGPVAMEIGARLVGGGYETFGDAGMRLDVPAETVKVFATGRTDLPDRPQLHERLAYASLPYVSGGCVTAVRGLDVIRALPTFFRADIPVKPGDRISPTRYSDECFCGIWLKAATEAELVRDLAIIHEVFRIEVA